MDAPRSNAGPHSIVHGEQTRAVLRVRKRQVDEYDLKDEEDGHDEQDDSERRHDPVDCGAVEAGPREEEEGRWSEDRGVKTGD